MQVRLRSDEWCFCPSCSSPYALGGGGSNGLQMCICVSERSPRKFSAEYEQMRRLHNERHFFLKWSNNIEADYDVFIFFQAEVISFCCCQSSQCITITNRKARISPSFVGLVQGDNRNIKSELPLHFTLFYGDPSYECIYKDSIHVKLQEIIYSTINGNVWTVFMTSVLFWLLALLLLMPD